MPRPGTPSTVDGTRLTGECSSLLSDLIASIYRVNPTRDPAANLEHALGSFRMMCRKTPSNWEKRPFFRIGKGGAGPTVILSRDNDA